MRFIKAADPGANHEHFDEDAVGWTLSWQPEGRCDRFTRDAILAYAPPVSGVYGLFNFDCQLFIGDSPNIQESLLRLESEHEFQSPHLRPTGFTFEPCAPQIRKLTAAELIARFHPVLQTEVPSAVNGSSSNGSTTKDSSGPREVPEVASAHQEFPAQDGEKQTKARWLLSFEWTRRAVVPAMILVSAVALFYFGAVIVKNIQQGANAAGGEPVGENSSAQRPASVRSGRLAPSTTQSANRGGGLARVDSELPESASPSKSAVRLPAKIDSADDGAATRAPTSSASNQTKDLKSTEKWSVQIVAAPSADVAATFVQRLKAEGHDAYVVRAEVKGQTYYRVRVGPFATREEAESARDALAADASYRDAYLAGD